MTLGLPFSLHTRKLPVSRRLPEYTTLEAEEGCADRASVSGRDFAPRAAFRPTRRLFVLLRSGTRSWPLWLFLAAFGAGAHAELRPVEVVWITDGDTVKVRRGGAEFLVRLLGIDAPERGREGQPGEPYARVATRFVQKLLARAERVDLEVAGDRIDKHGRVLGFLWVYLPGSPRPLNLSEELLREGLARSMRFFDYPGKTRFLTLEQEARGARRGIWRK